MEAKKKEKRAVIVGGSNGIGLSIAKKLMENSYHVLILDKVNPDKVIDLFDGHYTYYFCDLLNFDEELFEKISMDDDIEVLMITAGFGRVADFEYLHLAEIQNIIQVNTIAGIKIIHYFYRKIKSNDRFFCGMMASIAGLVSSPMFSVYAASKAGVCRFIESVNIELEEKGINNRILNVSPGAINGTRFNGNSNDLSMTEKLAQDILKHLFACDELFIPDYENVYKNVIDQYLSDAHGYGIHSYQYKKKSGRVINGNMVKIGYLSGTFDLFHIGHLNILRRAKEKCDYLIVGVHSSAAHKRKEVFIPFEERKAIVRACKYVDKVVESCPEDSDAWKLYHYDILFVGSDYKGTERFERYEVFFADKEVEIIYFPYTDGTSSTKLRSSLDALVLDAGLLKK